MIQWLSSRDADRSHTTYAMDRWNSRETDAHIAKIADLRRPATIVPSRFHDPRTAATPRAQQFLRCPCRRNSNQQLCCRPCTNSQIAGKPPSLDTIAPRTDGDSHGSQCRRRESILSRPSPQRDTFRSVSRNGETVLKGSHGAGVVRCANRAAAIAKDTDQRQSFLQLLRQQRSTAPPRLQRPWISSPADEILAMQRRIGTQTPCSSPPQPRPMPLLKSGDTS
jgi:hypothetical protein